MNFNTEQPVLIIAGPTASGKSGLALAAAARFNGTIINADSMQIYDALPLLTAQPPESDRQLAPHRLYGVLNPDQSADAQSWRDMAIDEIRSAHQNGNLPIITGGTGFYLKALIEGLSPIPPVAPAFRAQAQEALGRLGLDNFYRELHENDPLIADKIDPKNPQRLMRAYEVFHATGQSLIAWQNQPKSGAPEGLRFIIVTVMPDRAPLYRNCDARFDKMLESGALNEVKGFLAQDFPADAAITKAIGFAKLAAYLNDEITIEEASAIARQATRNYAKKQMTWLRNQLAADFIYNPSTEDEIACLDRIKAALSRHSGEGRNPEL